MTQWQKMTVLRCLFAIMVVGTMGCRERQEHALTPQAETVAALGRDNGRLGTSVEHEPVPLGAFAPSDITA